MGGEGKILNVLESMTDANTKIRRQAIEDTVARYPRVSILQTIGDINSEQQGREKIESALVARQGQIDGVICTGYNTTVAAALLLAERNAQPNVRRIRFVGIDTDERVLQAIRDGRVDATMAQNPYAQGYITCSLLKLMLDGWTPTADYRFIDSGSVVVTSANVDGFAGDMRLATARIADALRTTYLRPPADATTQ
jgi:ribose transport system substrate-binding protein